METCVFLSTAGVRTRPVFSFLPIVPTEKPKSVWYTSSPICPNSSLLACLLISVTANFSFILRTLRPPLFFRGASSGLGSALASFSGGGSINLSNLPSIFSRSCCPTDPSVFSWKLSTLAASEHFAATILAAFFLRSAGIFWNMEKYKLLMSLLKIALKVTVSSWPS